MNLENVSTEEFCTELNNILLSFCNNKLNINDQKRTFYISDYNISSINSITPFNIKCFYKKKNNHDYYNINIIPVNETKTCIEFSIQRNNKECFGKLYALFPKCYGNNYSGTKILNFYKHVITKMNMIQYIVLSDISNLRIYMKLTRGQTYYETQKFQIDLYSDMNDYKQNNVIDKMTIYLKMFNNVDNNLNNVKNKYKEYSNQIQNININILIAKLIEVYDNMKLLITTSRSVDDIKYNCFRNGFFHYLIYIPDELIEVPFDVDHFDFDNYINNISQYMAAIHYITTILKEFKKENKETLKEYLVGKPLTTELDNKLSDISKLYLYKFIKYNETYFETGLETDFETDLETDLKITYEPLLDYIECFDVFYFQRFIYFTKQQQEQEQQGGNVTISDSYYKKYIKYKVKYLQQKK